jgi:CRISPR-associated endonuclease Cas2
MYRNNYLIAYDISCNKRRTKVFKSLSERGFPLQYSVFLLHVSHAVIEQIWHEIHQITNLDEDNIFCVTLNRQGFCKAISKQSSGFSFYHDCPLVTKLVS